jgi:hypothetical protein
MNREILGYTLQNGYIDHWLVAGPQIIPVEEIQRFGNPPDRLQMVKAYPPSGLGVEGDPVEYGDCMMGEAKEKWRYFRARHDHLVDLSGFYPLPRYLRAWGYAEIESPAAQETDAVLSTEGLADVWINDEPIHHQEHFTDRFPKAVTFRIRWQKGVNRVMVRFETAAIRESAFGMALWIADFDTKADPEAKVVRIPSVAPSAKYRLKMEEIFETCHIRQDVFTRNEEINVHFPEGAAVTTPFNIRMQTKEGKIYAEVKRDGKRTGTHQPMGRPVQSPEGSYQFRLMPPPVEFYEQNVRISRGIDFYAATRDFSTQPYGTYPERRLECLKDASSRPNSLFAEVAKMETGAWKNLDLPAILNAIDTVTGRAAGSEILLCGLLGMRARYSEDERFPASLRAPLEMGALGFRYGESEPGADSMDFRRESGGILFPACEILAGQFFPEREFSNAHQTGDWHREKGERLALAWLQERAKGGFSEWDSPAAFEEIVLALSTITSLAENADVAEMAALVLDKLLFTLAVNSFQGVFGSTHASAATAQIKTGYRQPTAVVTRLLWGMGIFNAHILGSVSLACSTYELPPILAAIAADRMDGMWSRERHATGEGAESAVHKVTYKTPQGMLCSAQDWRAGGVGNREHIWQATLSPLATVFSTHPACAAEDNGRRPDHWSGNAVLPRIAQWKDFLIAVYQFPDGDRMRYTHAYFPVHAFDEYDIRGGWAFGRAGEGYLALGAARGLEFQTSGDDAYRELRSFGTPNIWLCQLGRVAQDGSFQEFKEKILRLPVQFDGSQVEVDSLRGGHLSFGWQFPLLIDGKEQPLNGFKHYENPYCTCEQNAVEMEIRYGQDALKLHFEDETGR